MEGVVKRVFCAGSGDGANLFERPTGAAGSAHAACMSVPRATKAISTSIICLMQSVLSLRYP